MSVAGTWNVTVMTPMGAQNGTFTVAVDGDSFTGALTSPMMGELAAQDGKVAGDSLTWKMDMKVPMAMTLEGKATVDGDTIKGEVIAGAFGSLSLSGTRG